MSAAAIVGVKAYNYYSMPELMRANLEALSQGENQTHISNFKFQIRRCAGINSLKWKSRSCRMKLLLGHLLVKKIDLDVV